MAASTNRLQIGNVAVSGFVNTVAPGRIRIGTGSYMSGETRVFKASITVFLDANYDGVVPTKDQYVEITGDLNISPRRDVENELNATMNVRFANQLTVKEAPKKRTDGDAPAAAPAADADI